jgi:hypothetical protein
VLLIGFGLVWRGYRGLCDAPSFSHLCFTHTPPSTLSHTTTKQNSEYLTVDPDAGKNWVKVVGYSGNVIEMGRTDGTEFSPLRDSFNNLIGFEGCTKPGLTLGSGLLVPTGASSITMDAHLQISYPAGQPQTSRVFNPDGRVFNLPACAAPTCVVPNATADGAPVEVPGACFASTADYTVKINVQRANEAVVTAPAACTLLTDTRTMPTGDGQLTYRCTGLARGATAQLAFTVTAKSEPGACVFVCPMGRIADKRS